MGKALGYYLNKRASFRLLQSLLSCIVAGSYGALLLTDNILLSLVLIGVANTAYAMMRLEIVNMRFDRRYFGAETLVLASGIMGAVGCAGAVVGMIFAAVMETYTAVACTFAFTIVQIVAVCSITDY